MTESSKTLGEGIKEQFLERLKAEWTRQWDDAPEDTVCFLVPKELRVIGERPRSFLRSGAHLLDVEATYPGQACVFSCLLFHWHTSAEVEAFVFESFLYKKSVSTAIASIEGRSDQECVEFKEKSIWDYVAEVANYELAEDADLGLAGPNCLPLNAAMLDSLDWPTPLLKEEERKVKRLSRCIRKQPDSEYSFRVGGCVVENDAVVWRSFRVFAKPGPRLDPGSRGEIRLEDRPIRVVLSGLPDNCRAKPGSSLGVPRWRSAPDEEGWEKLESAEARSILSDLVRWVANVPADPERLGQWSRQHLDFYGLDLLRIERPNSVNSPPAYILWKPGFGMPLDGSSAPIRQVNKEIAKEPNGVVVSTQEGAAAYASFYGRHFRADEGNFVLLKSKEDVFSRLNWAEPEMAGRREEIEKTLAAIAAPIATPELVENGPPAFKVAAWVMYGDAIYQAKFRVEANGAIEMVEDELRERKLTIGKRDDPAYFPSKRLPASTELSPLAARQLEKALGQGRTVEKRVLIGRLTRESTRVRTFSKCRFRGRVDFRHLVSDRLSFEECVFENGLDLSGASLKGALAFKECHVMQGQHHVQIDDAEPFSLNDVSVAALTVRGLSSTGGLSATNARVSGGLALSNLSMTTLDFEGVTARSVLVGNTVAPKGISFSRCLVRDFLQLEDISIAGAGMDLYSAVITNHFVSLRGVTMMGNLEASFLRVGTGFFLDKSDAGRSWVGSIELRGAHIPHTVRIVDTNMKSFDAIGVSAGSVQISGGQLLSSGTNTGRGETVVISDSVDLSDANIRHHVRLVDLEVGEGGDNREASLRLANAKVGGNVELFRASSEANSSNTWKYGISLEGAAVSGHVDLSGINCPDGPIQLENAEIHRNLIIGRSGGILAKATHLAMTGFRCGGEADITGLELAGGKQPNANDPDGAVVAALATFTRGLVVARSLEVGALIPGRLDLSGSTIGELELSATSFAAKSPKPPTGWERVMRWSLFWRTESKEKLKRRAREELKRCGISLKGARVDKVTIIRNGEEHPRPIDLRFSEIKWWEFPGGDGATSDCGQDYIDLLKGDAYLQRHTYTSIEKNLVNQGHDDAADEVHKDMRRWLLGEGAWKPFKAFYDFITESTTRPVRLALLTSIWLVVSMALFSNPANIGPSEEGLTAHPDWRSDRIPVESEWGAWDGLWMATRFHVPVAVFTARDEWEPANDRKLTMWQLPFRYIPQSNWGWISPEDYANLVLTVHWLIWPVMLIVGTRKYFRRVDK